QLIAGECRMKVTLIGRPQQVVERDTYVAFKLTGTAPPSLPKGLPKAPPTPLSWIVMVNTKQWAKVRASLDAKPATKAIIEGYPCMQATAHRPRAPPGTPTAVQHARRGAAEAGARTTSAWWARSPARRRFGSRGRARPRAFPWRPRSRAAR